MASRLKKDFDFNVDFAKMMLRAHGNISPMVIGVVGRNRIPFPLIAKGKKDLIVKIGVIKRQLRKLNVRVFIVISEVWSVTLRHPALYDPEINPSERKDRKEGVMVQYSRNPTTFRMIIPFKRVGGGFKFGEGIMNTYGTENDELWSDVFKSRDRKTQGALKKVARRFQKDDDKENGGSTCEGLVIE